MIIIIQLNFYLSIVIFLILHNLVQKNPLNQFDAFKTQGGLGGKMQKINLIVGVIYKFNKLDRLKTKRLL